MVVVVELTSFFLIGATASMDRYQGRQKKSPSSLLLLCTLVQISSRGCQSRVAHQVH